jgi:CBS domain-containing protein
MKVADLLAKKGHTTWSIAPDATVYEALEKMAEKNVGALLVMVDEELVGIVSERDYARKVILQGRFSKDTRVSDVMTEEVLYVTKERKVDECMTLMTFKFIRHLPVLEEGTRVIGMISIGDVVKSIIAEQEHMIDQYENYIRGWY